jgi:succinoglycan biosynthesis transport protein ExoP
MSEPLRQQPSFVPARSLPQTVGSTEEVGYYYSEPEQEKHLRDYWNILRKRKRHMLLIFCGAIALGLIFNFSSPTLYTAKSTLKIELQSPAVTGVGGVAETRQEAGGGPYDFYQTQYSLLKSGPLAARIIKSLGLESNAAFTARQGLDAFTAAFTWFTTSIGNFVNWIAKLVKGVEPREPRPAKYELGVAPWLVRQYQKFLEVTPVRNTRLVDIYFSTPSAKLSQELANAHAAGFIQMTLEDRFNLTQEARDFLAKKLAELREKVVKAETELNRFRHKHGVVSLEKGENIVVDRLVDLNRELTRVRAQRIEAESLYQMTRNKNTQYLAEVLNNPLTTQLRGNIANLETEKGRLLSIYTVDHPRIQELNQQIGEARKALNGEINNVVRGIESSYTAARAREEALEAEGKRQQDLALGLKQVGVDYAVLNEEVTVSRGLYESVLKRLNETNVGNDLAAANIAIMQRAEMPLMPSSPKTLLILAVSTILGLLAAVGYAFFSEYMDATVNTPQGVWAAVSLATLGVVPQLGSLQRSRLMLPLYAKTKRQESPKKPDQSLSKELVVVRDRLSMIAESYRTIRTALLLSQAEHPPKVILLTSPSPGDGKTMTSVNLAIALAQSEQRVLLIDSDLRKGRCHQLVNVENHHGLTNVLTGHASLQESVQQTSIGNFYVLPRGALPPNPTDLLMSQKMRGVLRELRESFDFIVIDSPPVIAVSDAAIVSSLCDGVLLVFHGHKTTTPRARRALDRLESIGAPIIGVILNSVDMRNPDYVDYRSYYGAYHAAVQEESISENGKTDGMIRNVEDVDNLVGSAGFRVMGSVPAVDDPDGEKPIISNDRRIVPQPFFDRMVRELNEALGPTAASVLHKQITLLRESMDAFPLSRAWELTQRVSQQIVGTRVKARFLHAMSEELRNCKEI